MAQKFSPGDTIHVATEFQYKGMPQLAKFRFSIGTGIFPTFSEKKAWTEVNVNLDGQMDWMALNFESSFVLPSTLSPGTYSARGTLRTVTDVTDETDTDWQAFEVVG